MQCSFPCWQLFYIVVAHNKKLYHCQGSIFSLGWTKQHTICCTTTISKKQSRFQYVTPLIPNTNNGNGFVAHMQVINPQSVRSPYSVIKIDLCYLIVNSNEDVTSSSPPLYTLRCKRKSCKITYFSVYWGTSSLPLTSICLFPSPLSLCGLAILTFLKDMSNIWYQYVSFLHQIILQSPV